MAVREKSGEGSWSALGFAWELGYLIVVPLVLGAFLGRFVDDFFGTKPWLFLLSIGISIVATAALVVRKTKAVMREIEEMDTQKKN